MLKKHTEEILKLLLITKEPITIQKIAETLAISEKTVWNKLNSEKMKEYLGDTVQMIKKNNVGVYLEGTQSNLEKLEQKLHDFTSDVGNEDAYRRNRLLMELLKAKDSIAIQDLSDIFHVSRMTTLLDLEIVSKELQPAHLQLEKRQNVGVNIAGEEVDIRQMLEAMVLRQTIHFKSKHHENTTFDEGVASALKELNLHEYLDNAVAITRALQKELVGQFTDEGSKELTVQILISYDRCKEGRGISSIAVDSLEVNEHFQKFVEIFERCHLFMQQNDYIFLWRRCINNRFVTTKEESIDQKFLDLSRELLSSVLDLQDNEEIDYLIKNLAFHIFQAVKRSSMGINVHNPILKKIKQKYGKFYSMVLTNVHKFEVEYNVSLNEDEIGFITIYICAIYEKNISNQFYKVLLVSDEGVGQRQLLSMQIINNFHNLLIHDTCNSLNLSEEKMEDCDIIISTCSLMIQKKYKDKYVRISNFIDVEDVMKISDQMIITGGNELRKKVINNDKEDIDFKYFECNLSSKEAIFKAYLQMAEQFGYCDASYMNSVFERETRASTSIGKGIAIPHGDDNHIIKPAVFFVRNTTSVSWGNEQVDIILFLILKFTSIHENKQFFMRLYSCMEKSELIRDIDNTSKLLKLKSYILEGEEC